MLKYIITAQQEDGRIDGSRRRSGGGAATKKKSSTIYMDKSYYIIV